jgi:hypothetical protein
MESVSDGRWRWGGIPMSEQFEESESVARSQESGRTEMITRAFEQRFSSPSWLARAAVVGLCITSLGFIVALAVPIASRGVIALITKPFLMQVALPPISHPVVYPQN